MGLFEIIIIVLLIAWLGGFSLLGSTLGALVHLLIIVAVVLFLFRLLTGAYRGGPR